VIIEILNGRNYDKKNRLAVLVLDKTKKEDETQSKHYFSRVNFEIIKRFLVMQRT
jgi:hypothetical protein